MPAKTGDSMNAFTAGAEFIRAIPKTDLHLHLDGSLRVPTLIELARAQNVDLPSYEADGLHDLVFKSRYRDLPDYLRGFAYTTAVMRTPDALERVAAELAEDNLAEGVRYIEVRFAPQLHVHDDMDVATVLTAVCRGLEQVRRAHDASAPVREGNDLPFRYGIIVCALRWFQAGFGPYFANLSAALREATDRERYAAASLELVRAAVRIRDELGLPIVGFDLAGAEAGYPAAYHTEAYQYAHSHFLKKTVHAGEAYGPESIFQAITECHANRIGHGTFLFAPAMIQDASIENRQRYVEQLADYIAHQRIAIEVCLTSNLQTTPSIHTVAKHPVAQMIAHNLSVSICTDNRLVSRTSVCRELELLTRHLPLTRHQFRNVVLAGFKGGFFPGTYNEKRLYVRQAMALYDQCDVNEQMEV